MVLMKTRWQALTAPRAIPLIAMAAIFMASNSVAAAGDSKPTAPASTNAAASSSAGKPRFPASGSGGASSSATDPEQAEKLAKRKERLEQGAQRLRDRAAELRKRIAAGETVEPAAPNSKRPPRSLEEQAARFEEQAKRMEERAKNIDSDTAGGSGGSERSPEAARLRRHQLRKSHINRRWGGATLRDSEAQTELKLHAERVAKLKRIRSLAMEKSKDDPLAKRAKDLLAKEEERHEAHMKSIQARVAPAAAAAAAAASGGANTPASTAPAAAAPAEESK